MLFLRLRLESLGISQTLLIAGGRIKGKKIETFDLETWRWSPSSPPAQTIFGALDVNVNSGMLTVSRQAFCGCKYRLTSGFSEGLLAGIAVAQASVRKGNAMYLQVIVMLVIAVGIPIFAVVTFLGIAKKRRHRRPVRSFR
jgi:hypothetical protein